MLQWAFSVHNFKSLRRLDALKGRPLTLLLGPNNAGKTSILQALLLLKGSLEYPEAVLSFRNNWVDLGSYREVVGADGESAGLTFRIALEGEGWDDDPLFVGPPDLKHVENETETISFTVDNAKGTLQVRRFSGNGYHSYFNDIEDASTGTLAVCVEFDQGFTDKRSTANVKIDGKNYKGTIINRWYSFLSNFETHWLVPKPVDYSDYWPLTIEWLQSLRYIGPLRSYPERFYNYQPPTQRGVGITGKDAPQLLMQNPGTELLETLSRWLGPQHFNLADGVRVQELAERPGLFKLELQIAEKWVNIRDVGFGLSQLLPVLVESLVLDPGNLLLLEQPELHLHPKAQADLGSFLAEMVRDGRCQYLIETHSEYLLMRIATAVREGVIRPEDVAIYFLSLDATGATQVQEISIDAEGRLPPAQAWPEGFFDTSRRETERFFFGGAPS